MSKQSHYIKQIHTECVNELINPQTTSTKPNTLLRSMILDRVKSGQPLNYSAIAREYKVKTGESVSRQWVTELVQKMGVYAK